MRIGRALAPLAAVMSELGNTLTLAVSVVFCTSWIVVVLAVILGRQLHLLTTNISRLRLAETHSPSKRHCAKMRNNAAQFIVGLIARIMHAQLFATLLAAGSPVLVSYAATRFVARHTPLAHGAHCWL